MYDVRGLSAFSGDKGLIMSLLLVLFKFIFFVKKSEFLFGVILHFLFTDDIVFDADKNRSFDFSRKAIRCTMYDV